MQLLKARMKKQLSVEELADLSGISGKQIRQLEAGRARHPRMLTRRSLAAALDVDDLEELFPLRSRR